MKIDREKIMEDLENIQTDVDSIGYKGGNEYELEMRERIADYIVKLFDVPVVTSKYM